MDTCLQTFALPLIFLHVPQPSWQRPADGEYIFTVKKQDKEVGGKSSTKMATAKRISMDGAQQPQQLYLHWVYLPIKKKDLNGTPMVFLPCSGQGGDVEQTSLLAKGPSPTHQV